MFRKKAKRNFISIIYTLTVTLAVGKWAVYMAYLERGYIYGLLDSMESN